MNGISRSSALPGLPAREGGDVRGGRGPSGRSLPEHVLEEDLDGHGQAVEVGRAGPVEPVDQDLAGTDAERRGRGGARVVVGGVRHEAGLHGHGRGWRTAAVLGRLLTGVPASGRGCRWVRRVLPTASEYTRGGSPPDRSGAYAEVMTGEGVAAPDGLPAGAPAAVAAGGHPRDHDATDLATHRHPHPPDDPSGRPRIGFVGAGRVGLALGVAFHKAGWPVTAVSSRDDGRGAAFVERVPGSVPLPTIAAIADAVDLLVLTVPDDALPDVAGAVRLYAGQAVVHTSGALGADVLEHRSCGGEPDRVVPSARRVRRPGWRPRRARLARPWRSRATRTSSRSWPSWRRTSAPSPCACPRVARPRITPPLSSPRAASSASSTASPRSPGAPASTRLGALADLRAPHPPEPRQRASAWGSTSALTGPFVRGDEGTIRAHLAALERLAPGALELYLAVARRELAIAVARGDLTAESAAPLERLLDEARASRPT